MIFPTPCKEYKYRVLFKTLRFSVCYLILSPILLSVRFFIKLLKFEKVHEFLRFYVKNSSIMHSIAFLLQNISLDYYNLYGHVHFHDSLCQNTQISYPLA